MFERFTEKARRAIFFARYEAHQYSSPYIELDHLLLGIFREDRELSNLLPYLRQAAKDKAETHKGNSRHIDIPLTKESKSVLYRASEKDCVTTKDLLESVIVELRNSQEQHAERNPNAETL